MTKETTYALASLVEDTVTTSLKDYVDDVKKAGDMTLYLASNDEKQIVNEAKFTRDF